MAAARQSRGQSVVEFAMLLPIMLALVGVTLDFARAYQVWVNLESASRSAAEQLAQNIDRTVTSGNAGAKAKAILEAETASTYTLSALGTCPAPTVAASYGTSTTALGASGAYPIGTATVTACVPFRPLFAYPLLTTDGVWVLHTQQTFAIVQGR